MRVGIDIRELSVGNTGISQYTLNILNYLNAIDKNNEYILFSNKHYINPGFSDNFKIICDSSIKINTLYENLRLPYLIKKFAIDNFFSPYYKMPFLSPAPCSITVHDIGFITFPLEFYSRSGFYRIFARQYLKASLKFSSKIAAVSEYTKSEIIKEFNVNPDKIKVLYNSVNILFHKNIRNEKKTMISELKKKYGEFIFSVSNYKPHKNIKNLIDAFALIRDKCGLNLLLAGPNNIWKKNLNTLVNERKLADRIFFAEPEDNSELSAYYSAAVMLCHPSLFEGFGLPIVEAQSCGCPVVSSPRASLSEIVGNSGVFIEPDSSPDIAEKLLEVYNNGRLREDLILKGFINAENYRPQKSYNKLMDILETDK